jgi:hypothetical protein
MSFLDFWVITMAKMDDKQPTNPGQIARKQVGEPEAHGIGQQRSVGDLGRDTESVGSSHGSAQNGWITNHGLGAFARDRASRRA